MFFFKGRRDRIVPWGEISECKSSARAQEWISARLLFGGDRQPVGNMMDENVPPQ